MRTAGNTATQSKNQDNPSTSSIGEAQMISQGSKVPKPKKEDTNMIPCPDCGVKYHKKSLRKHTNTTACKYNKTGNKERIQCPDCYAQTVLILEK